MNLDGQTVFLFPGQGSQSLGMLAELATERTEVAETFGKAAEVLDYDLWALCQSGPEEQLNRTEFTQPAMLAADIATWQVWKAVGGPRPGALAGHSLGEYAALVAAGSLAFDDALRLVRRRGQLMQAAVPEGEGAMAAILGLDDAILEGLCEDHAAGEVVSCANYNAPGQVVIAGARDAVGRVCEAAKGAGARRALPLPVSVPSHCDLMRDAAEQLASELATVEIAPPALPVLHNADVNQHATPDAIRAVLARQLWQPVRWTATIQRLVDTGCAGFAECGPGKVLTGLNRRISRPTAATALVSLAAIETLKTEMQT